MLSAIVIAPRQGDVIRTQEAVVRTLGVLVGASVADLVRDACIAGPPGLKLDIVADHAGCAIAAHADPARALNAALLQARCDHVLVLEGGAAPAFGFIDELSDWVAARGAHAAVAFRLEAETLTHRIFPALAPVVGLVARKTDCLAVEAPGAAAIARKLRAKTLRTRARKLV
ncbi:MAG: transposase [Hyphomicrobiales bacterium]|nr:transposase [Hyphomicrobiales bacterium]